MKSDWWEICPFLSRIVPRLFVDKFQTGSVKFSVYSHSINESYLCFCAYHSLSLAVIILIHYLYATSRNFICTICCRNNPLVTLTQLILFKSLYFKLMNGEKAVHMGIEKLKEFCRQLWAIYLNILIVTIRMLWSLLLRKCL